MTFKCKMCGGELDIRPGTTITICEYCSSKQTIPYANDEKKITMFSRANRLRLAFDFDKAAGIYESIVADFPEEAEAYWGLILCKYGIEYVDDPLTGNKIPTSHRSSFDGVMDDSNFEMVMEYSDAEARKVYREEAKAIEELRKSIIEVSSKEEPYDVFICYKETAADGQRTIDSVLAQDIYDALNEKEYRVFFSRISLEDKIGLEYEPYIFAALNSAKVMLVFGTEYDYFNAVWVKNEWARFLHLMATDKSKHLIPCYKNIDAYDIPKEFQRLQAQDLGKIGATQDLLRGIDKLISATHTPKGNTNKLPFANINVISSVNTVGSPDPNNPWPKNSYSPVVDIFRYSCVFFHIFLNKPIGQQRNVKVELIVYDSYNNQISDLSCAFDCQPAYDKFSKGLILKGDDGSTMSTGKYKAKISVDGSIPVYYNFEIINSSLSKTQTQPTFDPNIEKSVLKLVVKDSINPLALADGSTYVFTLDGIQKYKVVAGDGNVTSEVLVPIGNHRLSLKVYGYDDTVLVNPLHTVKDTSIIITSGRTTTVSANRPGFFSSVKLDIE